MVMHTLNCTYGGGINHEAESCCCFLGRIAEQIKVQTVVTSSSQAKLSALLPQLVKLKVDLVGV